MLLSLLCLSALTAKPIDRHALVSRHNVELTAFNNEAPLQVGNGEIAFGMDATGLQTFVPFNTMSQWGWHSSPLPAGKKVSDYKGVEVVTHGRMVRYPLYDPNEPDLSNYLAANPHRINLGRIGLNLVKKNGEVATQKDIKSIHQKLDLWSGIVTSRFTFEGEPVKVVTSCHPSLDMIGVTVESPLVVTGRITAFLDVPGNDPAQFANLVGDRSSPARLEYYASDRLLNCANFLRHLDNDDYYISVSWQGKARFNSPLPHSKGPITIISATYGAGTKRVDVSKYLTESIVNDTLNVRVGNGMVSEDPALQVVKNLQVTYTEAGVRKSVQIPENGHFRIGIDPNADRFTLRSQGAKSLSFVASFSKKLIRESLPDATKTQSASSASWEKYWKTGGAIDLSGSKDPRWNELERRIVLSQYLMKVNEAGSLPPQESGLVNNGWFGKFHMEMYWWHAAHWALWNKWDELKPSISIYDKLLPNARALAASQGYKGARWPKCEGPTFVEWPHEIHSFLNWQQPHPIFFAELDYQAHPTVATLKKWQPIVEGTADYLATYAFDDKASGKFVLGPPIHLVSENTKPLETKNPTFELGYWRFGLRVAQEWRQRLGMKPRADWAKVQANLAPLPVQDGLYVTHEGIKDMWTKWTFEHPGLTGVYGLMPGDGVDKATMRRTIDQVVSKWDFNKTWGWDFPMMAMCAAKVGEPDKAIDLLLTKAPGFQFDDRGLATGGPFPYFPSNGGLLYATALMAAGWEGSKGQAPGFPKNGWVVKVEGLNKAL